VTKQTPLILQIQEDCLNSSIQVAQILLKAKVAATKLELQEFLEWINVELNGYAGSANEIPPYREITGSPKAFNPHHGWQSIIFENSDIAKIVLIATINQPISTMKDMVSNMKEVRKFIFPYAQEIKEKIAKSIGYINRCSS